MVAEQNIIFREGEVIDLDLVLVEKNDELLEKMLDAKDLSEKRE